MDNIETAVTALAAAHLGHEPPIEALALSNALDMAQAYNIQARLVQGLAKPVAGWKLAVATKASQQQNGLAEPTVGRLLEGALINAPASLKRSELNKPVVEPEVALILAQDIGVGHVLADRAEAQAVTAAAHLAIELADTRYTDQTGRSQPENVADNCGAAYLILGPEIAFDNIAALTSEDAVGLTFEDDTKVSGFPPEHRPDPFESLIFLSEFAAREDLTLTKGQVITTGTWTLPTPAQPGKTIASFGTFGQVELSLTT